MTVTESGISRSNSFLLILPRHDSSPVLKKRMRGARKGITCWPNRAGRSIQSPSGGFFLPSGLVSASI